MYSPKINEDLVRALYRLKQTTKRPMTLMVNEAVAIYLTKETENGSQPGYNKNSSEDTSQNDQDNQAGNPAEGG